MEANYEMYLATVAEMLTAEVMPEAATLLREADSRVEATGYDNWNGGTTIWTIFLSVPAGAYARLSAKRKLIESQINDRLKEVIEQFTSDWCSVSIVPAIEIRPEWREGAESISEETRRNIIDGLRLENVLYCGRLSDVEFLSRIFDLKALPSHDSRFKDLAGDIWQHRVNNPEDWSEDWVYEDTRLNLLKGPSDRFLQFLCEIVHPVVRPDRDEALRLAGQFNDQLRKDGWTLVEQEKIAGRPRFVSRPLRDGQSRAVSRAKLVGDALDAGWMQIEIERLENAIDRDPALAIGTAKELVETCCKTILTKRNVTYPRSAGLPELTKLVAKELKLVPEGIPSEAKGSDLVRLVLRNLSSLTNYLAELRGLYGSGHGRDGKHRGLEPRHARLAAGAAVVFIDFVTETHRRHNPEE